MNCAHSLINKINMSIKHTKLWRFFSSIKLAVWLLAIIALFSLVGTLIPQNQDSDFYLSKYGQYGYQVLSKTGLNSVYSSWWFILCLILFALNLSVCILNRFSIKNRSLGSFFAHFSILVILIGALIGMFLGQKGYIQIKEAEEAGSFISQNKQVNLGFSIRLNDFIFNESIDPKEKLLIYSCPKEAVCGMADSAKPGKSDKLIAEISTDIGAVSDIGDTGYSVKILRYVSDFMMDTASKQVVSRSATPNNPAIELEVKDKKGNLKKIWAFARFPDMHQEAGAEFKFVYKWETRRPKDFISKVSIIKDGKDIINQDIRVNEPLHFGGYTFFQSSYDNQDLSWSGLQVVNDPGVPVIYLGFILLIVGLVMIFYINPLTQQRR